MTRRMIFPALLGVLGVAVLLNLGFWQLRRMDEKAAQLAEITAMIGAEPLALMAAPAEGADKFRPVRAEGRFTGEFLEVLAAAASASPGVKVIAVFEVADGRRVLVDRGFLLEESRAKPRPAGPAKVVGNLHWPQEVDRFTPAPDLARGLWFARDVGPMAAALQTEPVLIVAREPTGQGIEPRPVDTAGIPNDHWGYAIQWFAMAAVWAGMTVYLLWRIRRRTM